MVRHPRQFAADCRARTNVKPRKNVAEPSENAARAERANADKAEEERQRADSQQRRAEQLAAKLRELGIDPAAIEPDPDRPELSIGQHIAFVANRLRLDRIAG